MLLKTKLLLPKPHTGFIARPRLLEQLDNGLQAWLTLVRAPAGYGKTMLVADWIRQRDLSVGWLSLDSADSTPTTFAQYLIAAAQQIQPTCCTALTTLDLADVLPLLINDLVELETDSVLVLDDYHLIESEAVHRAIAYLLDHMPPRLHLMLTTRSVPPLPLLPRLRVRGQLVEIDAAALRFTNEEAGQFLSSMHLTLTTEQVTTLETRTEGWIAGLQLAAVSMQGRTDADRFIENLSGRHLYIVDYLAEEALGQSSAEIQQFLLDTCILDTFTAVLCDAVRERQDSQQFLDELERKNLFLIPLDSTHRWYRYHRIFDDFLNGQLARIDPDRSAALHRRAARWFVAVADVRTAIDHFLQAHAYDEAAEQIAHLMPQVVAGGEADVLKGWLDQLSLDVLRAMPVLLAMRALISVRTNQVQAAQSDVDRLREIDALDATVMPIVTLAEAEIATWRDEIPTAIERMACAYEQFEPSNMQLYAADRLLSLYQLTGNLVAARQIQAEMMPTTATTLEGELHQLLTQGDMSLKVGLLHEAARLYRQGIGRAQQASRTLPIVGALQVGMGCVLYEWGELVAAEKWLTEGLTTLADTLFQNQRITGMLCSHNVMRLQGDRQQAADWLEQTGTLLRSFNLAQASALMDVYEAQFALHCGDIQQATRWLRGCGLAIAGAAVEQHTTEYLVLANVLVARGEGAQALPLLMQVEAAARTAQQRLRVVESLVAQGCVQTGDAETALAVMEEALKSAEPENIVRPFLDHPEPTKALLQQLRRQKLDGFLPDYIDDLLTALTVDAPSVELVKPSASPDAQQVSIASAPHADVVPLLDPLTERELDVLSYLAQGLSNQQIADAMFVAVSTTRTHLSNLYSKLSARSRTHAVMWARELGILAK